MPETCSNRTYSLSRGAGIAISAASIAACAALFVPIVSFWFPASLADLLAVLIASLLIPVVAVFRPLQTFAFVQGGLELSNLFSRNAYTVHWSDVTEVRVSKQRLGIQNLVLTEAGSRIRKKVPLSLLPERAAFVSQLGREFPAEHPLWPSVREIVETLAR